MPLGVTPKAYAVPLPTRFSATPLITVMSSKVNPVTGLLNVAVREMGDP